MSIPSRRIEALDVLRGITVALMIMVNNAGDSYALLHHSEWNGLTLSDLVFPFFLYIVGASCYLSLFKHGFKADRNTLLHIGKRTVLIILVCWGIFWFSRIIRGDFLPFDHFRLTGVLVRIALTYGIISILAVTTDHRYMPLVAILLLAAYSAILYWGNGYANDASNIIARVDAAVLGKAHLYAKRPIDPEGLVGLIPSVAHGIFGFLCGATLRSGSGLQDKMKHLATGGLELAVAGLLLSLVLPVNKRVWSPSYVLLTCGMAQVILAGLMYVLDYRHAGEGRHGWATFFKAFGMNSLAVYVLSEILETVFGRTGISDAGHRLLQAMIPSVEMADLCYAVLFMLINYLLAVFLYKRRIVIKL